MTQDNPNPRELMSQVTQIEDTAVERFIRHIQDVVEDGVDAGGHPTPSDVIDFIMSVVEWARTDPIGYARVVRAYVHARTIGDVRFPEHASPDSLQDGPLKQLLEYADRLEREAWEDHADKTEHVGEEKAAALAKRMVAKGIIDNVKQLIEDKTQELAELSPADFAIQEKATDIYDGRPKKP